MTKADFYVGFGPKSTWVGTIFCDGYLSGIPKAVKEAVTVSQYKEALAKFFKKIDYANTPAQGWPWHRDSSEGTDYVYTFKDGQVWMACNVGADLCWVPIAMKFPHVEFPDMSKVPKRVFKP